ncbi:N-acetyllactosaminide beta-1,6-N-acetylglucosaminyl-transferase-like [Babylonia areolata]|uniref:N-acetyllactosaminide beta-1,6-N-acetylglucosaminyl-transferase-like n=1 Tax=Babylonia areolata TaxID=304850 RepID=UPI003FD4C399
MKMHRNAEQAEQLLRAIYRPHNIYCIHVDNKTDRATFSTMESLARCFPNVFLTKRLNVVYGGPLMVEAELVLMNCALESPVPWKYYLNLAGQEFPLRTNLEMVRILQMLNGSNDIKSVPMPKHLRSRIDRVYVIRNGRIVRTFRHKDTPNTPHLQVRKGTQYGAFSRDFVTSLFVEDVARTIISYFADTYSSDETVWATINGYPGMPGGYPVNVTHSHLSRTIVWQSSNLYKCRGRYVHGICVFSKQDLPWLLKQPNLIANKFGGWADSYQAARCLEAVLDQRARSRGDTVNQSYVRNSPHVRFRDKVLQEA